MTLEITTEAAEEFRQLMQDPASRDAFVEIKRKRAEEGASVRYGHIFEAMTSSPWAIYPPYMSFLVDLIADRMAGVRLSAEDIADRLEAARRAPRSEPPAGVAVIAIHGPIVPRASMLSDVSGATSIPALRAAFRESLASKEVSSIVFDVDSPGGNVQGVPEMAQEIRAARGKKPMTAVATGLMASAAYWLGSQTDEIVATKSSLVGSIGVITSHVDMTKAAEMEGAKETLITAGKFKTLGHPMEPLTDEGRARIQSTVNEFYSMFVSDVAKGRRVSTDTVRSGFGEGDVLTASQAVSEGMIDRVGSLEDVVGAALSAAVAGVQLVAGAEPSIPEAVLPQAAEALALEADAEQETPGDEPENDADTDVVSPETRDRIRRIGLMKLHTS